MYTYLYNTISRYVNTTYIYIYIYIYVYINAVRILEPVLLQAILDIFTSILFNPLTSVTFATYSGPDEIMFISSSLYFLTPVSRFNHRSVLI